MEREQWYTRIDAGFQPHPVVAILGPRQCGKTTLARHYAKIHNHLPRENYFDLEDEEDLQRLANPKLALEALSGLIVIDEVQRRPELFKTLRVLADQHADRKFLILGSASRELIKQSSESLAGRIAYLELTPFSYEETKELDKLWLRGGFPPAYLAKNNDTSIHWRKNYIRTYLEQDIMNLGIHIAPLNLRRFWQMLTHYHGQTFNASEIGRSLGLTHPTIRHYLDILTGTFMVRQLQPWFANVKKRQVKSPKIYLRDSGLYHYLMGIYTKSDLLTHPKLGASWEGFALEEIIRSHQVDQEDCYFWAAHAYAELDLLLYIQGKRIGFEFKYQEAPKLTRSMQTVMEDIELDKLTVIYPGKHQYELQKNIVVCGLQTYLDQGADH